MPRLVVVVGWLAVTEVLGVVGGMRRGPVETG
jgi:hypothetical protein